MFENNEDFDFDNELFTNSFTPVQINKRTNVERDVSPYKKPKAEILFKAPAKIVVKRKFPGPAGILPDNFHPDQQTNDENRPTDESEVISCSQTSLSIFDDGPWRRMIDDFKGHKILPDEYNIRWIKMHAILKKLINQKAPFLAAIIENIEYFNEKVQFINVNLKDLTGEIKGTISQNLYKEYSNDLKIGSVIILKQFGVLTSNHILNITPNNLVTIYCRNCREADDPNQNYDEIKKVTIQNVNYNCLIDEFLMLQRQENCLSQLPSHRDRLNKFEQQPSRFAVKICDKPICHDGNKLDQTVELEKRNITTINCSQVSLQSKQEHRDIWENVLEGLDADSLFDDF